MAPACVWPLIHWDTVPGGPHAAQGAMSDGIRCSAECRGAKAVAQMLLHSGADLADPRERPAESAVELHTHAEVADLNFATQIYLHALM